MQAAIGWAPHRPNYSKYETGKSTPNRETLAKFVEFWATRDVGPPELAPVAGEAGDSTQASLAALLTSINLLVEEMRLSRAQQDEATLALLQAVAAVAGGGQERPETPDGNGHELPVGTQR